MLLSLRDALVRAVLLIPVAWMAAFAALCTAATLMLGRLPSYGNPDPKQIEGLGALLLASQLLLVLAVASPLAVAGYACLSALLRAPADLPRGLAGLYLASGLIMTAWIAADPFELLNWMMD